MAVPYTFGSATSSIPLSQLDSNFATAITLGNTAVYLGNTTTSIGNLTLTNVTISSGSANITANVTYGNANAVVYTNGSNVGTTSTALTFDGATLGISRAAASDATLAIGNTVDVYTANYGKQGSSAYGATSSGDAFVYTSTKSISIMADGASSVIKFSAGGNSEQMRLTSTGLGIGTSSPAVKLHAYSGTAMGQITADGTGAIKTGINFASGGTTYGQIYFDNNSPYDMSVMQQYSTGSLRFGTNNTERMRLDSSGNLGLGVTPSAWNTGGRAIEIKNGGNGLYSTGTNTLYQLSNAFLNSAGDFKYSSTNFATQYTQYNGTHSWHTAPSGTAGNAITFTQAMTLDASGNLAVGITSYRTAASYTAFALNGTTGSLFDLYAGGTRVGGVSATSSAVAVSSVTSIPLTFLTADTERARIDSSGRVCIGGTTVTDSHLLNIQGSTAANNIGIVLNKTNATAQIWGITNTGPLAFYDYTASTERMRISSSGNLLVGTTSSSFSEKIVSQNGSSYTFGSYRTGTGSEGHVIFVNGNGAVGSIFTNASVTLYNTTSDQRLKENIQDADSASSLIDSLQVRKFDWKANGSHQRYGFVAQELLTVAPEAVNQPENTEEMMAVDYSKLVPMLVKEIQSLRVRVAQLESN